MRGLLKSVARYGELTVDPDGTTALVAYPAQRKGLCRRLEGSGTLLYGDEKAPIKKNDFMYLPVGVRHGIANKSSAPVKVMVMGYRIPDGAGVKPTPKMMLDTADDVKLQILPSHGPSAQFKLLMGTTASTRDKLSAAYVMTSLFIMDFAPGGTNIPHHHATEEEIYLLLRGSGDMVADSMRTAKRCATRYRGRNVLLPAGHAGRLLQPCQGGTGPRSRSRGALVSAGRADGRRCWREWRPPGKLEYPLAARLVVFADDRF